MIIRNALINDAVHRDAYIGDMRVSGGKITGIGQGLDIGETGETELDAIGLSLYPGFVDAHSHLGMIGYGASPEIADDTNEMNDIVSPQLRGLDGYNPMDLAIPIALRGGVTTVCVGPGSADVLGGTALVVKLRGKTVEEAVLVRESAMKCAFGENPKRCYRDKSVSTRYTTAAKLREALFNARDYMLRKEAAAGDITKEPKYDIKAEALIPVLKRKIPLKAHAHRADDIMTALRIAGEFDLRITLEHCTEGHLITDALKEAGVPVAVGPGLITATKFEVLNRSWTTPGILAAAGVDVSIITDAPVVPQEYLPLCAGLAVKAGMDPFEALKAITVNAAKHIGVQDRVGSLEIGKDADFVLSDGDPMFSDADIRMVFLDGEKVYENHTCEKKL